VGRLAKPVIAALSLALLTLPAAASERRTLVIAAGEVTGFYFPVAGAVCRAVNKERPRGGTCAVLPSSGSAANLAALKNGDADMAVVQSKALLLALGGEEGFKELGAMPDLRAVMSLHGEATVVLARPDSGINFIGDLKGKRVNLGRPGSFQRAMGETVLDAAGLSLGDLSPLVELDFAEQAAELCRGNIDAAVFTGVHPIPEVAGAVEECGAALVAVKGKAVDAFVKKTPWLSHVPVKGGTYDGQKDELSTIGVKAVLVTTTRLPAEDVLDVLKSVSANFGAFTRLHPVLRSLTKKDVARDGLTARLHDGAEKFFAEAGLK
jgi:TRAP transporter TAXI family solute receptor